VSLKLAPPPAESDSHVGKEDDPKPDARGFRAQLDNLNLWDLIQMECLSGARKSVSVRSGSRVGYLFFERGQLVHALLGNRVGDAAALGMLAWESGEVVPCDSSWPRSRTVKSPWQSLLMQAAQLRDHQRALADGRATRSNSGVVVIDALPEANAGASSPPAAAGRFPKVSCQRRAQLDAQGEVVALEGPDNEFAGRCGYALRLCALLGECLALGPLSALEVRTPSGVVFAYFEADGGAAALEPSDTAGRVAVRKQLGL